MVGTLDVEVLAGGESIGLRMSEADTRGAPSSLVREKKKEKGEEEEREKGYKGGREGERGKSELAKLRVLVGWGGHK